MEHNKWANLGIKEKIAIVSAIAAFVLGWGLSIAGFWIPPVGEVADSVLWILGQSLIYAASVFGITGYFTSENIKIRHEIDKRFERIEHMRNDKKNNLENDEEDELEQ